MRPTADENQRCDHLDAIAQRSKELYTESCQRLHADTDRLFVILMIVQWIGGVLVAWLISPQTWSGSEPQTHIHVVMAVLLGGLLSAGPIAFALFLPGATITRHVVAIAQMCWSGLLIHLSGGRIETHFHVFGSLAFIAFYRDWRTLMTATAVTAVDHIARGYLWPQSIYGIVLDSSYRWFEHTAWVVFTDIFLVVACIRSNRDSITMCQRAAELEQTNAEIEDRIEQRTKELREANAQLDGEFLKHKKTQVEREHLYSELASVSRQAGMAEVATGVLHNVGNILNSVNVSAQKLVENLRTRNVSTIERVGQLLTEQEKIGEFMQTDPRGQKIPELLGCVAEKMHAENADLAEELRRLAKNVEHIKHSIAMQQSMAKSCSNPEPVFLAELIEDCIAINSTSFSRHSVEIRTDIDDLPEVLIEKHKVMQILVNLIKNAKQAAQQASGNAERWVQVSLKRSSENEVTIGVTDNGIGIDPANIPKLFTHGFTTKKDGHGFGLHSAAIDAKSMGGRFSVHSEGLGQGASFSLILPDSPPRAAYSGIPVHSSVDAAPAPA